MSQKLRRVLLLVGVVDSGVLVPVTGVALPAGIKVIGEGLVLKTREPLRCLGLSFTSFTSGKDTSCPTDVFHNNTKCLWTFAITKHTICLVGRSPT